MPLSRIKNDGQKVIRVRRERDMNGSVTLVANTTTVLEQFFRLEPKVQYKLLRITGTFGISDDPSDERVDWKLILGEALADSSIPAASGNAIDWYWSNRQQWRTAGTSFWADTSDEVDFEFEDGAYTEDYGALLGIQLIALSGTTSSINWDMRLEWEEIYVQKRFKDDFNDWGFRSFEDSLQQYTVQQSPMQGGQ